MRIKYLVLILSSLAVSPLSQAGAVNYFLKLDGIEGESNDKGHANEIQLTSYVWGGVANPLSTSPTASGKVSVGEITVTKPVDKSSTKLMSACATGQHIKEGTITMRKGNGNGEVEFLVVTLKEVIVTSFQTSGDGDAVTDKITLSFSNLSIRAADGSAAQIDLEPVLQ